MLRKKDADINAPGGLYRSALQAPEAKGDGKILGMLLENGTDFEVQIRVDGSPLKPYWLATLCGENDSCSNSSGSLLPCTPQDLGALVLAVNIHLVVFFVVVVVVVVCRSVDSFEL
jgi:hypothetical protein